MVPDELQSETSGIDYWLNLCGSGGLEECDGVLIPFYEERQRLGEKLLEL